MLIEDKNPEIETLEKQLSHLVKLGTAASKARSLDVFDVIEDIHVLSRSRINIPSVSLGKAESGNDPSCSTDIDIFKTYISKPANDANIDSLIMQRERLVDDVKNTSKEILGKCKDFTTSIMQSLAI